MISRLLDYVIKFYFKASIFFIRKPSLLRFLLYICPYEDLRQKLWVKTGNKLGKDCVINAYISVSSSSKLQKPYIILGDRVALASNISFIVASYPNNSLLNENYELKKYIKYGNIVIGNDAWIGTSVIIHPGVIIGERSIVGAGSNVTRDVPDDCVVVGNPAKVIRELKAYKHC